LLKTLFFLLSENENLYLHVLQKLTYSSEKKTLNIHIGELNKRFEEVCVFESNTELNSNNYSQASRLIAIGCNQKIIIDGRQNALQQLQQFIDKKKGWLFGYLSYDVKNEIENLTSTNDDGLEFPVIQFFAPTLVIKMNHQSTIFFYDDDFTTEKEAKSIFELSISEASDKVIKQNPFTIQPKISKEKYIDSVNQLKQHIRKGDIYEVNFCQEFFAQNTIVNPVEVYEQLNNISAAPFSAYCKFNHHYLMCASPERFIQKNGNTLVSQPIKGTIKRSENKEQDEHLKESLRNSTKEKSENVMIVDLVRNDLSRIAKNGSVKVEELFGIYTFKQVHQMISTIRCELKENVSFTDIIRSTFPMGSMTGAPKVNAMKLIEAFESTKRGLYSGAIGYISPENDFDFNVVIRSILYNEEKNYLSFMVGSAITEKANAEEEYEECLLKAKAMFEVLQNN
jgi:para-aminobenzoate synthetase component 1